jgi:hypothetical protein
MNGSSFLLNTLNLPLEFVFLSFNCRYGYSLVESRRQGIPSGQTCTCDRTPFSIGYHSHSLQLYIDAADSNRSLSATEIRTQVRQLVAGLKHHGLRKEDCVCVVSFNDVRTHSCSFLFPHAHTYLDPLYQPVPRHHWVGRALHGRKSRLHSSRAGSPPSNNSSQIHPRISKDS